MFCPRCGQEQGSEESKYRSRCGFPVSELKELIANDGVLLSNKNAVSGLQTARKRGLKKGLFIFLLTFLFVPIISIITMSARAEPTLVAIVAIVLFVGGLLRMVYALMFESNEPIGIPAEQSHRTSKQNLLKKNKAAKQLPFENLSGSHIPPIQGNWRETNDLAAPSVTEGTTKLLEKEFEKER